MSHKYKTTDNRFYKYERLERRIQQEYGVAEAQRLGWAKNKIAHVISNVSKNKKPKQRNFSKLEKENNGHWVLLSKIQDKSLKHAHNIINTNPNVISKSQRLRRLVNKRGGFKARVVRCFKILSSFSLMSENFKLYFNLERLK